MKTHPKTKRWAVTIAAIVAAVGLLGAVKAGQIGKMLNTAKTMVPPPESVTSAKVMHVQWEAMRPAIGTLVAAQGVTLGAADARAKQPNAAVAALQATIAKKTIRATFDRRISIRQVELGQAVAQGTPIGSLQSVSPIHADFWLPQQALAEVRRGQKVRMRTDIFPKAHWEGEITTVNPEVDVATRNVRVRATFPNRDGQLRPGMFTNVEVLSSQRRSVLVMPATAAIFAPYGDSVFALEQQKDANGQTATVAKQKFVRLGERRGDFVEVVSGLAPGETIVSSGGFKLRNGMAVAVNDTLAPNAQVAPMPTER